MKVEKTLQVVLQYQDEVKTTKDHIHTLKTAIREQRESIQQANSFTSTVPELLTCRENLLADIILKKRPESDLESLDLELQAAQSELDKNSAQAVKIVSQAKDAIAGLERQLAAAEQKLSLLQQQKPEILYEYLLSEAENVGSEYRELCIAITEKHRRLLAIDGLINKVTNYAHGKSIQTNWNVSLELPLFKLNACSGLAGNAKPGFEARVMEAQLTRVDDRVMNQAKDEERDRIISLGIEF
jgi:hypothetical protein